MAKVVVSEGVLARLRKEIAEHGTAILGPSSGDELYIVQPAGGFFEPEDDDELAIVLDAARDTGEPLYTPEEARQIVRRELERG